jgi:hypothetical protein
MVKFDPLLSSRDMANLILSNPPGQVIIDHHYYTFSSIAFYTGRPELLLNGRWNNFEYGSNAPGTPNVFIVTRSLSRYGRDTNAFTWWQRKTNFRGSITF